MTGLYGQGRAPGLVRRNLWSPELLFHKSEFI